ncbi:MAG TPA: hypothetical protein VGG74_21375 [Kofleriaceae bacterium]
MKLSYRGYELEAKREQSLGGDSLLYWSVFRESDQFEVDSGFSYERTSPERYIKTLQKQVDERLA